MPTPQARAVAHLRSLHLGLLDNSQGWAARISTWLVLGNGGALVLLFGAFIGGESRCDLSALMPSAWAFASGLALAFGGTATAFLLGLRATKLMGDAVEKLALVERHEHSLEQLESRHGGRPDDSPLNKAIEKTLAEAKTAADALTRFTRLMQLPLALYILSIIAFGVGLALPLGSARLLASCAG